MPIRSKCFNTGAPAPRIYGDRGHNQEAPPESSSTTTVPSRKLGLGFTVEHRELLPLEGMSTQRTMDVALAIQPEHVDLAEARRRNSGIIEEARPQDRLRRKRTKQRKMMTRDSSGRQIAYKDYIAQAWGRTVDSQENKQLTSPSLAHSRTSSLPSEHSAYLSPKERQPKLQVTIPQMPPASGQAVHNPIPSLVTRSKEGTPNSVSPPSTTTRAYEIAPARLSIVSPLSVVEMPKPRRPFSTHSIEHMSRNMPSSAPPAKTENFDIVRDDRSSNYSRSSGSTVLSEDGLIRAAEKSRTEVTFSVYSPTAAGTFDVPSAGPKVPQHLSSLVVLNDAVRNKPLPPEPGVLDVTPLAISKTGSLKRRNGPAPLNFSRPPTLATQRHSTASSLRSKYSPADLDRLDEVFQRRSPLNLQPTRPKNPSPTFSQAEMDLEQQLRTIEEDPVSVATPSIDDPLQIKRGTGRMEPSRPAPCPPAGAVISKKQFPRRAASHIASMMRWSDENGHRRVSRVGSRAKVQKILGEENMGMAMERKGSVESNWSSSESRSPPNASPNVSTRGDTTTPETDVSSIPDQTYDEVKARLDLLNPHEDALTTFLAIRGALESQAPPTETANHDSSKHPQPCPTEAVSNILVAPLKISRPPPADLYRALEPAREQRRQHAKSVRSLASIAASEIPDLYAALPSSPVPSLPPPLLPKQETELTQEEMEQMISADAAERVLLRILDNIDNLQDLFSAATVSRGFYRTFKRHELSLMKNALFSMSAAAWELRESSLPFPGEDSISSQPYTPTTYLQDYMRDMYTMIALKSMILIHCESFLRADTVTALAGGESHRAAEIDDAFWRVWTFCKIFGHGTNREDDIVNQMDWLRGGPLEKEQQTAGSGTFFAGFGRGNKAGLSADALYDMTEIWTCLGVLVRGLQTKRELAREAGIFDNAGIAAGDVEYENTILEEWTYHILTLAPPAVLDVTGPSSPTATTFSLARSRGYTSWKPPAFGVSRSTFLKEAVSRVYEERMTARRYPTVSSSSPIRSSPVSPQQPMSPGAVLASRQRCQEHAAQIRRARQNPNFRALPASEERPMSNWPDILDEVEYTASSTPSRMPPTPIPQSTYARAASSSNVHVPRGPQELYIRPTLSSSNSFSAAPVGPQVRDPVDVAIDRLVAMGFDEKKSKKALADTDNGNGIDFDQAVEALVRERKRAVNNMMHWGYRGRKETVPDPNLGGDTLIAGIGRSASGGPPVRYN